MGYIILEVVNCRMQWWEVFIKFQMIETIGVDNESSLLDN